MPNTTVITLGMQGPSGGGGGGGGGTIITQANWWIDPVNGSDSNSGILITAPLKTNARLMAIWGLNPQINQDITVTYLTSQPDITVDPLNLVVTLGGTTSAFLIIKGTPVTSSSGAFSAVTAKNPATQQRAQVKDGSRAWPLGKRIRITTAGPRFGAWAFIQQDLGSGNAQTTDFQIYSPVGSATWTEEFTFITPQIGDTYVIEDLTQINLGLTCPTLSTFVNSSQNIFFQDLHFGENGINAIAAEGLAVAVYFVGCRFVAGEILCFDNSFTNFFGCHTEGHVDIFAIGNTSLVWMGGGGNGNLSGGGAGCIRALGGSQVQLGADCTWLNFPLSIEQGGYAYISTASFFGNTGSTNNQAGAGVMIGMDEHTLSGGGHLAMVQYVDIDNTGTITPRLWGNGHTGPGIAFGVNSALEITKDGAGADIVVSITGTGGDWQFGPLSSDNVGVFYDSASQTQSAPLSCTWAHLYAAQPTGFGGSAHYPLKNNHITSRQTANAGAVLPTVTSGTGVPAASALNGSIFLRTDGTASTGIYTRQSATWSAVGATVPTGTGWIHGTAGVLDAAAITNGDLVPTSGAAIVQSLSSANTTIPVATAALAFGTNPATVGTLRFPYENSGGGVVPFISNRNAGNSANNSVIDFEFGFLTIGSTTAWNVIVQGPSQAVLKTAAGPQVAINSSGLFQAFSVTEQQFANVSSGGNVLLDIASTSAGNGSSLTIQAQSTSFSNGSGGPIIIKGGQKNGSGNNGGVQALCGNSVVMSEVAEVYSLAQVVSLCLGSAITSTQLPASTTGGRVIFIGECTGAPTTNSVGGGILFVQGGALKYRGPTTGTITTIAAA